MSETDDLKAAMSAWIASARACRESIRELRKYFTALYACRKWSRTIEQCKRKRLPAPKEES